MNADREVRVCAESAHRDLASGTRWDSHVEWQNALASLHKLCKLFALCREGHWIRELVQVDES